MRVGIFDSGVGGLTVLEKVYSKYPNAEYIYIGDNKNCPYGDKTKEELFKYASTIIDYFILNKIEIVVIACNTICSNILDVIKEKYKDLIIIGVIDSTINSFIKTNKNNALVIGTEGTIKSKVYENKIKSINNKIKVHSLCTKELVPLIEEDKNVKGIMEEYLKPYNDIDSIILGCTHYKLIEHEIKKDIEIINSSDGVAFEISKYLVNDVKGSIKIYTTGNLYKFNKLCNKIMNMNASKLNL